MAKVDSSFFDIGYLDALAGGATPIHRLDPRAKLLTTIIFIGMVVSFGKYEISGILPFIIYPAFFIGLGNLPVSYIARKMIIAAPFAFFIGIFNPFFDREIIAHLNSIGISGGWVSFTSIMLRFALTVSAALVLIATTGFNAICMAMERMGVPRVLVVQMLFLYRYIFVLTDEAGRMARARALRSFEGRGMGLKVYVHMIGQLLLRTLDRAQRIHMAMLCRGFDGEIRLMRVLRFRWRDAAFLLCWTGVFIVMRLIDIPQFMGRLLTGIAQ